MSPTFDESSARRPDFIEDSYPVRFPGGLILRIAPAKKYYFPLPDGTAGIGFFFGDGRPDPDQRAAHIAFAEAVVTLLTTRSDLEVAGAVQVLGRHLILRQYDVAPEVLDLLLTFVPDNPDD